MVLSPEELVVGAVVACALTAPLGIVCLIIAPISGFLWALSGGGASKLYRRLGVPILVSTAFLYETRAWWYLLTIPMMYGALTLGYGIPDETDRGSWLGRQYFGLTKSHQWAHWLTRWTIYLLLFGSILLPALLHRGL